MAHYRTVQLLTPLMATKARTFFEKCNTAHAFDDWNNGSRRGGVRIIFEDSNGRQNGITFHYEPLTNASIILELGVLYA